MSTSDFSPQVNPRFEYTAKPLTANPKVIIPSGSGNSLKAGSATTKTNSKLGARFPGITFTGWIPPDPDIAVGPNHIVAVVNSDVAFFDKATGQKTFQQPGSGSGFFSGIGVQSTFTFDPKCYYDKISGRFFVLFLEADTGSAQISKFLLAVSDDSNPNGTWFKYRIESKITEGSNVWWLDYPGFGINKDAVVISGNMFPMDGSGGGVFTSVAVIPKAPLLSGGSATASYLKDATMFTLQPARTVDPAQAVMYGATAQTTSSVRLVAISNLLGSPTMSKRDIPVASWLRPNAVPAGADRFLDGLDGRLYNCHFRAGRLVTAHTTRASNGRMKVRWYEFSVGQWPASGNPSLRQSGDILLANSNTHMPAINTNAAGDISVIYSKSDTATNPQTCISSRFLSDTLGSIGAPQVIASSAGLYGGVGVNRWGDYFAVEVDPVDNLTFWGVGMVAAAGGNWTTHIDKWKVSTSIEGNLVDPTAVAVEQGSFLGGNLASILVSDNSRYSIQSIMIDKNGLPTTNGLQAIGMVASMTVDFDLDLSGGAVADLKAVVEANVIQAGATGQVYAYDWGTGTFKSIGAFSMSTTDKTSTVAFQKTLLPQYVDGTGNVRLLVRAFASTKSGRGGVIPPPYIFNVDRVALSPTFNTP